MMRLNTEGQFTSGEWCNNKDSSGTNLTVQWCQLGTVNGPWEYIEEKKQMFHSVLKKCLGQEPRDYKAILSLCDDDNAYQRWVWRENKPWWERSYFSKLIEFLTACFTLAVLEVTLFSFDFFHLQS